MSIKSWLEENNYSEYLGRIATAEKRIAQKGIRTRRSWFEAFAGKKNGQPRFIHGVEFPVIKAIRKREGLPPVSWAIEKKKGEKAPPKKESGRWSTS